MDVLVLIGRILFVLLFLSSGFGHFAQRAAMVQYAQFKRVPMANLAVPASGLLLIAGSLSVLLGVWADLGALLLLVFLVPTAFLMHAFWKETDAEAKQAEMVHFNKDIALAGAALMLFAFFAHTGGDLGLTLTGPLFSL
ncbi:DoxX family protein [Nocardia niigatensis]